MDSKTIEKRLYNRLWSLFKSRSKRRGKPIEILYNHFVQLSKANCVYCYAEPSNVLRYDGLELKYSGIDRIDSAIGYTNFNSAACCSFCNSLKGSMKSETWFDFLNSVVRLHGGEIPFPQYSDKDRASKSTWNLRGST